MFYCKMAVNFCRAEHANIHEQIQNKEHSSTGFLTTYNFFNYWVNCHLLKTIRPFDFQLGNGHFDIQCFELNLGISKKYMGNTFKIPFTIFPVIS